MPAPKRKPRTLAASPLDTTEHFIDNTTIEAVGEDTHGIESVDGEFTDPSALEAPPPRPGYVQLWVRTHIGGQPDAMNVGTMLRKGWKPRLASSVPQGFSAPTIKHDAYGDVIGIEGMILCEMPKARHAKFMGMYDERTKRLVQSVNQTRFAEERPGHPIHKVRKTTVTKRPDIASE